MLVLPAATLLQVTYGLQRLDHAVGNVPELIPQVEYMRKALGELTEPLPRRPSD